MKVVLIVLGVLAGLFLLLVGGCAALVYFGLGQAEEAIKAELQKNPVFVEKVGTIEDLSLDFGNEDGGFTFVGSKASGTMTVKSQAGNDSVWTVELDNGETFEVMLSEAGATSIDTSEPDASGDGTGDGGGGDAVPVDAGTADDSDAASQPAGG